MSSDEEMPNQEESQNEDLQLAFVVMLEDFKIILDKKMTPAIQSAKEKALKELTDFYTKQELDIKRVLKTVNIMKTKIKKITDMKKTGNKKITLNEWQQKFYDIWNGNENPVIQRVPGGVIAGTSRSENEYFSDNNEPIEKLQKKLLIQQMNTAISQEKAALAQERAAVAIGKAAGAVEKFVEDYIARQHSST